MKWAKLEENEPAILLGVELTRSIELQRKARATNNWIILAATHVSVTKMI